jgi:uncharacterized YccA/Bax inhibitor family protein
MRGSNPTLNEGAFERMTITGGAYAQPFTVNGVIYKTAGLLALVVVAAAFMWNRIQSNPGDLSSVMPLLIAGFVVGLILCLVISFVPATAPFLSPIYALAQGAVLGTISAAFELSPKYEGLTMQAVALTFGVFVAMLLAYRAGLIKATEKFKSIVIGATMGICLTYLISFGLRMFGIQMPFIHDATPIGIGFSLFVVVLASMNLILDFDFIDQAASKGADKKMEWFGAFGLTVTLIWLYIEILRLLAKLRR